MPDGTQSAARFAVYYTPHESHPLTLAAACWLGRSPFARGGRTAYSIDDPEHVALTAEPSRYGFHATIKPPFRINNGHTVADLENSVGQFCSARPAFPIGSLRIEQIGKFFALVPAIALPALGHLAAQAMSELDRIRAPMNQDELKRRLSSTLDEVETANLVRWGYPYVFDRFRFHMTLTGPVVADRQDTVRRRLDEIFTPLIGENFLLDTLSLFVQESPETDFVVHSQFPMRADR